MPAAVGPTAGICPRLQGETRIGGKPIDRGTIGTLADVSPACLVPFHAAALVDRPIPGPRLADGVGRIVYGPFPLLRRVTEVVSDDRSRSDRQRLRRLAGVSAAGEHLQQNCCICV